MRWIINNMETQITHRFGRTFALFDKTLRTDTGAITGVKMVPRSEVARLMLECGQTVNVKTLHLLLRHACKATCQATAKHFGLNLKGQTMVCMDCALAKARQKNVSKESQVVLSKPGECFYMDISSTKAKFFGGNKFWLFCRQSPYQHVLDFLSHGKKSLCNLADKVRMLFLELRQLKLIQVGEDDYERL
jgi:hypothetical protein